MKLQFYKLLLYLFCIAFFVNETKPIIAQNEWAPIGAKWYYGWRENPFGGPDEGYLLIESYKDSIIKDHKCRVLRQTRYSSKNKIIEYGDMNSDATGRFYFNDIYIYNDGDKLYFFDYNTEDFHVLYDFSLNKNDTLITREPYFDTHSSNDSILTLVVDSVGTYTIDGHSLRYYSTSRAVDSSDYYWNWGDYVEFIGSLHTFFPINFWDCDGGLCPWPLRCYVDSTVYFQFTERHCDEVIANISGLNKLAEMVKVFPNPSSEQIIIEFEKPFLGNIAIYDIAGKMLLNQKSTNDRKAYINLSAWKDGIYYLHIYNNKNKFVKKIIKNK